MINKSRKQKNINNKNKTKKNKGSKNNKPKNNNKKKTKQTSITISRKISKKKSGKKVVKVVKVKKAIDGQCIPCMSGGASYELLQNNTNNNINNNSSNGYPNNPKFTDEKGAKCFKCGKMPGLRGTRNYLLHFFNKKKGTQFYFCKKCYLQQYLYTDQPNIQLKIYDAKHLLKKFLNEGKNYKFNTNNGVMTGEEIERQYIPIVITPDGGIMADKFRIHYRKPYYDKDDKRVKLKYVDKRVQRAIRIRRVLKKVRKKIFKDISIGIGKEAKIIPNPILEKFKNKFIAITDNNFTLSVLTQTTKPKTFTKM
tara:strand:+ start:56 stop:985 length:930 start_codon:yes stop_codon:yes gene_type:complete